jgi:hypothetical protein
VTAYQLLPGLTAEEYAALRADIAANGVRVPVDVDENGQVLDGHHRSLIAAELGIDCPRRTLTGLTEAQKVAHAIAVNVHRRTLTQQQKRELLAESIKAEPEASDREHARRVGTSPTTASTVRSEMEQRGDVSNLDTRRDSSGRQQPASKPPRLEPSPPSAPAASVNERPATPGGGEPDLTGVVLTREQFLARRDTGEVLSPEDWQKQSEPNPIAAARAEVAKQPVVVTDKAVDRLRTARLTFEAAGTPAEIVADLANSHPDTDNTGFWLAEIEAAMSVLNGLAVALRRRNLRSVTR